ncbi:QueT transporter family protein [uncultured Acetobacterium sp.]|uniref:QueT transporter family protein n=1 Tax=uncultured Acetobacterium sp. TaxID=217139 RepID=UPI002420ADD5|nr:QueT transporter family protein [uncultured Acetobacterium sp.]MBU4541882.1 QueT transporter family protein [Bacillota bacterium]
MRKISVLFVTQAAVIAAMYVVLTFVSSSMGLASGEIQIRLSEMLCILPAFTPAAIPGLFLGCLLSNLLTGCTVIDIVFGSLATLIAAVLSYQLRNHKYPLLITIPPVVVNMLVVPFILKYSYGVPLPIPVMMATVGIGQVISCMVLGSVLYFALDKRRVIFYQS